MGPAWALNDHQGQTKKNRWGNTWLKENAESLVIPVLSEPAHTCEPADLSEFKLPTPSSLMQQVRLAACRAPCSQCCNHLPKSREEGTGERRLG